MSADPAFTLRRASAEDADALALIGASTFLETFAGMLPGSDIVAHCRAQHAAPVYAAWLADAGAFVGLAEAPHGAPVGYVVLSKPDLPVPTGAGDVELKRIYALSRFHGSGLGGALMAQAIDAARSLGAPRMLIGVYARNARARRFYEKKGFVLAGERRFRVGAGEYEDVIYARTL